MKGKGAGVVAGTGVREAGKRKKVARKGHLYRLDMGTIQEEQGLDVRIVHSSVAYLSFVGEHPVAEKDHEREGACLADRLPLLNLCNRLI